MNLIWKEATLGGEWEGLVTRPLLIIQYGTWELAPSPSP